MQDSELQQRLEGLREGTGALELSPFRVASLVRSAQRPELFWWNALWLWGKRALVVAVLAPALVGLFAVQGQDNIEEALLWAENQGWVP